LESDRTTLPYIAYNVHVYSNAWSWLKSNFFIFVLTRVRVQGSQTAGHSQLHAPFSFFKHWKPKRISSFSVSCKGYGNPLLWFTTPSIVLPGPPITRSSTPSLLGTPPPDSRWCRPTSMKAVAFVFFLQTRDKVSSASSIYSSDHHNLPPLTTVVNRATTVVSDARAIADTDSGSVPSSGFFLSTKGFPLLHDCDLREHLSLPSIIKLFYRKL